MADVEAFRYVMTTPSEYFMLKITDWGKFMAFMEKQRYDKARKIDDLHKMIIETLANRGFAKLTDIYMMMLSNNDAGLSLIIGTPQSNGTVDWRATTFQGLSLVRNNCN